MIAQGERDLFSAAAEDQAFVAEVTAVPTRALRGMVRGNATIESQHAAVDVLPKRAKLQREIMGIVARYGPVTGRELGEREEFADRYCYATVLSRVTELKQAKKLVVVGRKDKMALYDVAGTAAVPR